MVLSVENSRATSIWLFSRAGATWALSNDVNLADRSRPYLAFRPGMQNGLVAQSAGPPSLRSLPLEARSESVFRPYLSAVALVTTKALVSTALLASRATRPLGVRYVCSLVTVAATSPLASPFLLLRNSSIDAAYSGAKLMVF